MRCINCESTDKWENVDQFRLKPEGMAICTGCGFVSYPSKWKSEEEIKKHYRSTYRNPPNANNTYTGQRKLHFHNAFLQDVFELWKKSGKKNPKVFEVGAAYGVALAWMRDSGYPGSEVAGTELTTSYRRNAWHEFNIALSEDFDTSKKYDLIMSYKVAEHQLDVDRELRKYAEHLTDDGLLHISVPTWFDSMTNFGAAGFDLEYYYDPNHINVWQRDLFEGILRKSGLEIVKADHIIYDSTYLCKRNDSLMGEKAVNLSSEYIKSQMEKIHKAYLAFIDGNLDEAIRIYPNYPIAHINRAEMNRKALFDKGWDAIQAMIATARKDCPEAVEIVILATDFAMRANKWEEAIALAEEGLSKKPENPSSLNQLINIMREMALRADAPEAKRHYFKQAREISRHLRQVSQQHYKEAMDYIMLFNAHLPMEGEV